MWKLCARLFLLAKRNRLATCGVLAYAQPTVTHGLFVPAFLLFVGLASYRPSGPVSLQILIVVVRTLDLSLLETRVMKPLGISPQTTTLLNDVIWLEVYPVIYSFTLVYIYRNQTVWLCLSLFQIVSQPRKRISIHDSCAIGFSVV